MENYPNSLDRMLAVWNETDSELALAQLESAVSAAVRFVDPSIDVVGIEAFAANVEDVKARLPGAVYSRTSRVDSQHGFHRYHWAIHQAGKLVLSGFDVTQTDSDGKVCLVIGFFGELLNGLDQA